MHNEPFVFSAYCHYGITPGPSDTMVHDGEWGAWLYYAWGVDVPPLPDGWIERRGARGGKFQFPAECLDQWEKSVHAQL